MTDKPKILVTRKLPPAVEKALVRNYEALLNADDQLYSADDLISLASKSGGAQAKHPR